MSDTEPTKLTNELQQIITSHTMELKAGHDHLMFEQVLALIQSTLEDCLPERMHINTSAAGWGEVYAFEQTYNAVIDHTKANLKKLMGEL